MTISSTQAYVEYSGDSSTTSFTIPFYFLLNSDIYVMVADADGNVTELTNDTDFTVTGQGVSSGGTCVLNTAYSNSYSIFIYREPPETQETKYYENGKFPAKSHELALDKLTMLIQRFGWMWDSLALKRPNYFADYYDANGHRIADLQDPKNAQDAATKQYADNLYSTAVGHADDEFKRTLRVPESTVSTLPTVDGRAGRLLAFNNVGQPIAVHTQTDGGTQLEVDLAGADGLKYIGRCPDLATLATIEPEIDGQVIDVVSYSSGWESQAYGMPFGGGRFIYISALSSSKYIADGGTIVVTSGGKVWIREELYRSKQPKIYAEWFGCDGTFYTDDTAAIQKAHAACLFWQQTGTIDGTYSRGGVIGARAVLVFPKQWSISSTITINQGYVGVDYNDGIGLILSTGTYNAHQKLSGYSTAIDFNGAALASSVDYVAAYYSNVIAKNGTLIYGTIKANGQISRAALADSKVVLCEYRGSTESIRSAVGSVNNVTYSSGGVGYTNGDYGWGYIHNDSKYDNCYEPYYLVNGSDNGELIRHNNCMILNCGTLGNLGDWTGDFQSIGGSFDYPKVRGLYLGTAGRMPVILSPGRIEYNPGVVGTLIDGTGTSRKCVLSDTLINFSAPTGSAAISDLIFDSSFDMQFKLADSTIIDNSSSGSITKGYKITGDNRVQMSNVSSLTLTDYFIAAGCINAQGVADWQIVGASSYLTATKSITGNTLTITSSATAAVEQNIYIFVPLKDKRAFHQVTGMITATKPSVTISSYFGIGAVDSTGAIQTSYYIDSAGTAFSLQSGITYPYGTYSGVTLAKSYTSARGAAEDGMVIKLNCYNLISGSGSIVIDASRTGAITL